MKLVQLPLINGGTPLMALTAAQVRELQTALSALGYSPGAADGILGPNTSAAWASFKQSTGSGDPDQIGPASIAALQKALDAAASGGGANGVPPQAVAIVKHYEGLRLAAYDDGVGVWTIGYGTTRYPNGQPVRPGDTITQAQADQYFVADLTRFTATIAAAIPVWSALNANQRSALISFAYNLGAGFYGASGFETITRTLAQRRFADVPQALLLYSNPGDPNVHAGLLARRQAEGQLWQGQGPYAA
ncbi:MAG TPA: glycoside hydrolase family protein [Candidatus Elarobacter sp.]|jgi:GH24 family phage-related lysozyme (muramidase)|nr:glycoside hydrolase family protein [Candidatus Elarobacter sp.]